MKGTDLGKHEEIKCHESLLELLKKGETGMLAM